MGRPKHRPAGFPFVQSHAPQSDHVLCLRVRLRERGTGLCSCCRCRRPVSVHLVAPARVLVTRAGTGTSQPDGAHESRRQGRFPAAPGRLPAAPSYQQFLEVRVGATSLLPARRCVRPSAGHGCSFQSSSEGERQEGLLPSRPHSLRLCLGAFGAAPALPRRGPGAVPHAFWDGAVSRAARAPTQSRAAAGPARARARTHDRARAHMIAECNAALDG
jgi:hypothetical protein